MLDEKFDMLAMFSFNRLNWLWLHNYLNDVRVGLLTLNWLKWNDSVLFCKTSLSALTAANILLTDLLRKLKRSILPVQSLVLSLRRCTVLEPFPTSTCCWSAPRTLQHRRNLDQTSTHILTGWKLQNTTKRFCILLLPPALFVCTSDIIGG